MKTKFNDFINEKKNITSKDFKYNKEGMCPVCSSKKLKYKGGDMNNTSDDKNYVCKDCGFKGTEVHEFDRMDIPKFSHHSQRNKNLEGGVVDWDEDENNFDGNIDW